MFVLLLTYVQSLDEVDRFVGQHADWLDTYYASGRFVASGRRVPRTGGVILARGDDLAEIEAIVAEDPFAREQIASYEIIQFEVGKVAEGIGPLTDLM